MRSSSEFASLSSLLGAPMADVRGEVVGHITELLVDRQDGRVAYVQFSLVNKPHAADGRITVPWSTVNAAQSTDAALHLRVKKSALITLVATANR